MTKKFKIGIVLLAAGSAERMKQNKLLLKINGKTLLENATEAALTSIAQSVFVILGANAVENKSVLKHLNPDTALNGDWEKGIGTSIKCGLKKLLDDEINLQAVIISVSDQPHLTSAVFDNLITEYFSTGKPIIASVYNNSFGVPVLYDKSLFNDLLNIPDEHGAKRSIIEKAEKEMLGSIPFPKGEIDIDTIEDIKKLPAR